MSYIKPIFIEAGGLFVDGYSRGELQTYLIRYVSDILSLKIDNDNCWQYKVKKKQNLLKMQGQIARGQQKDPSFVSCKNLVT